MTNQNEKYNGWNNYETWNFFLWYGDELQDNVNDLLEYDESINYGNVYTMVNGFSDQLLEDSEMEQGFFSDAIGAAMQRVDLYEITQTLCDNNNIKEDEA